MPWGCRVQSGAPQCTGDVGLLDREQPSTTEMMEGLQCLSCEERLRGLKREKAQAERHQCVEITEDRGKAFQWYTVMGQEAVGTN